TPEQLAGLMTIKPGDAFSRDKSARSVRAVREAYGRLGYADARVQVVELRDEHSPQVDMLLIVHEGQRWLTGLVHIRGTDVTQPKLVRRHGRRPPGRPLAAPGAEETRRYLERPRLFKPRSVRVTIQGPDPGVAGTEHRDVVVEVKE